MGTGIRHGYVATDIGDLLLVAVDDELAGLYFPDHWHPPAAEQIGERIVSATDDAVIAQAARELREYLGGTRERFEIAHRGRGGTFDERVWEILERVPYGATTTYREIALELGNAKLARRVGYSVGHNPLSIVVGCHRVLGSDGRLTGYAGGLERKRLLLDLEARPR